MKHILSLIILLSVLGASSGRAQGLKIAVVDMEQSLREYFRTAQEVEKINQMGEEKIRNIDERKAVYEKMTSDMVKLDKSARATELSEDKRREAVGQLEEMARARNAKANEIGDAERKASQELYEARQKMETELMGDIKTMVEQVVVERGFDMVFDKSFLPKASKSILYTSPKVTDVTNEVISRLNSKVR